MNPHERERCPWWRRHRWVEGEPFTRGDSLVVTARCTRCPATVDRIIRTVHAWID